MTWGGGGPAGGPVGARAARRRARRPRARRAGPRGRTQPSRGGRRHGCGRTSRAGRRRSSPHLQARDELALSATPAAHQLPAPPCPLALFMVPKPQRAMAPRLRADSGGAKRSAPARLSTPRGTVTTTASARKQRPSACTSTPAAAHASVEQGCMRSAGVGLRARPHTQCDRGERQRGGSSGAGGGGAAHRWRSAGFRARGSSRRWAGRGTAPAPSARCSLQGEGSSSRLCVWVAGNTRGGVRGRMAGVERLLLLLLLPAARGRAHPAGSSGRRASPTGRPGPCSFKRFKGKWLRQGDTSWHAIARTRAARSGTAAQPAASPVPQRQRVHLGCAGKLQRASWAGAAQPDSG